MPRPATAIAAVVLGLLLGLWHGFYGLSMGLGSIGGLFSALGLLVSGEGWWAFQSAWQSALGGLISLARLVAGLTLLGGSIWFVIGKGRGPLLVGAGLALLAHGLGWAGDAMMGIANWQLEDDLFYYSLADSWWPVFLLDAMAEFAFLRLPLRILLNAVTGLFGAAMAAGVVAGAMAPATTTWLAAGAAPERSDLDVTSADEDDETTIPEGDLPRHVANPDEEATEMASEEELAAMVAEAEAMKKKQG